MAEFRRRTGLLINAVVLLSFLPVEVFGLTCLQCDGISQPRHCRKVVDCGDNERCFIEKTTNSFDDIVFNLGCSHTTDCSRLISGVKDTCAECCGTHICNSRGCQQPDYPTPRGPICYSCSFFDSPEKCHNIDFCGIEQTCKLTGRWEFSDLIYSSSCVSKHNCQDNTNSPAFVGRRDTFRRESRSFNQRTCEVCCSQDLCNKNCNSSSAPSTTSSLPPTTITTSTTTTTTSTTTTTTTMATTPSSTVTPTTSMPKGADCKDILDHYPNAADGLYTITVTGLGMFKVFCDMTTDGGGWTVFQYRFDGSVDFYRNFSMYQHGFGQYPGEYWMGLDPLHQMTSNNKHYQLRVDLTAPDGTTGHATYSTFSVGASPGYRLNVGGYSGNIGDKLAAEHDGSDFSTYDRDQDHYSNNCAREYHGAWWYGGCCAWWYGACYFSNLNGAYYNVSAPATITMHWYYWPNGQVWETGLKGSRLSIKAM